MTKEQAKDKIMQLYGSLSEELKQAIDVLVDAPKSEWEQMGEMGTLFAEATKDCVSRKAVEEITWEEPAYSDKYNVLTWVRDKVRELTPVTPDLSEFIDKLYKLAYERGKAEVPTINAIILPDNATNGDVIDTMFCGSYGTNGEYVHVYGVGGNGLLTFTKEWWNAPYKQEEQHGASR